LDADLIRKARLLAVERSMSVSSLVARELERLVTDDERYRAACREALATLERGYELGGGPYPRRDDLYDR
jgi:hypothetical protein